MTPPNDDSFIATAIASTELLVVSRTGEEMPVTVSTPATRRWWSSFSGF